MENTNDIITKLRVPAQFPLNAKEYILTEALLQDLGVDDNLAYTYHKGLEVTCLMERTKFEWKEIEIGDVGLIPSNFTYSDNLIVDGVDYSLKVYNFVKIETTVELPPLQKIDEGNGIGIIIRDRNPLNYGSVGLNAIDLSYSESESEEVGATGDNSFAEGLGTTASGLASHAQGSYTTASAYSSHAQGNSTYANGIYSHAEGVGSDANGDVSHAEGSNTTANGEGSHSEGGYTEANGNSSHAGGYYSVANAFGETSIGHYGTVISGNSTTIVSTDRLFNIGNGTDIGIRSNAFTILKNGLATLPSVTNALISAGSPKSIVTREYLEANSGGTPDATDVVKGKLKLTNDLGGNADAPTTPTAIHKTGNEVGLTGNKAWTDGAGKQFSILDAQASILVGAYSAGSYPGILIGTDGGHSCLELLVGIGGVGDMIKGIDSTATTIYRVNKDGDTTAKSFIKTGGTDKQYLMADGSTSAATTKIINAGWFSGMNVGTISALTTGVDIVSAITTSTPGGTNSIVLVTMANAMPSMNYYVATVGMESLSASIDIDNDITTPTFKKINTTQFELGFRELAALSQNLKVHLQVISY